MDQLIELLSQIQELAGVAIDALKGAGGEGGAAPECGAPAPGPEGSGPPEASENEPPA